METRSAKRKRLSMMRSIEEDDRISELPDHLLHSILLLLPMQSAAITSTLSRRWRNVFSSIPDLDFTNPNTPEEDPFLTMDLRDVNSRTLRVHSWGIKTDELNFINQVLSHRHKNSCLRSLKFRGNTTFTTLNKIIRFATKFDIQELDMDVETQDYFNFPRSIINCESLKVLRFRSRNPGFRLAPSPVMSTRFKSLHTLSLSLICFNDQPTLVDLFLDTSFPSLKNLALDSCYGLKELKLRCPELRNLLVRKCYQLNQLDIVGLKLERLKVEACFVGYNNNSKLRISTPILKYLEWAYNVITFTTLLDKFTVLNEAVLNFFQFDFNGEHIEPAKRRSLSNFIYAISHAKSLTFQSQSIEVLSKQEVGFLLNEFESLRKLEIHTDFNQFKSYSDFPSVANLFVNSPYIHTLVITNMNRQRFNKNSLKHFGDESNHHYKYWEDQVSTMSSFLNHLKMLKFDGFIECDKNISLVKFLIKRGNILEDVILSIRINKNRQLARRKRIFSILSGLASTKVQIVFD